MKIADEEVVDRADEPDETRDQPSRAQSSRRSKSRASSKGSSAKAASAKGSSAKAAPTKGSSTKGSSAKAAPARGSSTKAAPTKAASTKAASTKAASTKAASTKAASTKAASTKAASKVPSKPDQDLDDEVDEDTDDDEYGLHGIDDDLIDGDDDWGDEDIEDIDDDDDDDEVGATPTPSPGRARREEDDDDESFERDWEDDSYSHISNDDYEVWADDADDADDHGVDEFMHPGPASVDEYLAELGEFIAAIVERLRVLIREAAPEVEEGVRWGMPHYAENGHLVYVDAKPDHVNLGFFRGDELARLDPARSHFQGAGGKLRHIRLYSADSIPEDAVRALIHAAVDLNRG